MFGKRLINTVGGDNYIPFSGGSISSAIGSVFFASQYSIYWGNFSVSYDGLRWLIPRPALSQNWEFSLNVPYQLDMSNQINYGYQTAYGEKHVGKGYFALESNIFTGVVEGGIGSVSFGASNSTFLGSFNLPAGSPYDINFTKAGTEAVVLSNTGDIYVYSTSIPFRFHSATWVLLNTYTPPRTDFRRSYMSDDGTTFFGMTTSYVLYQYSLSTNYNINTASQTGSLSLANGNNGIAGDVRSLEFATVGSKFYVQTYQDPFPRETTYNFTF